MRVGVLCGAALMAGSVISGCAPRVELRQTTLSAAALPREENCAIDWYKRSDKIAHRYGDLGEVYVRDDDYLTFDCGEPVMRERIRQAACKAGADAAVVLVVRKPDIMSPCTRIRARLLKYGEYAAATLLPLPPAAWHSTSGLPKAFRRNH